MSASRKTRAVLALLTAATMEDAAAEVGVSGRTLRRWCGQEDFLQALEAARRELWGQQCRRLAGLMGKSLDTLEAVLDNPEETTRNRINAAKVILSHAQASELAAVVKELEQQLSQMEGTIR